MNYTSFLNWLISKMQASSQTSVCRLCTDTRADVNTWHMQPIVHLWPKALAVDATAVPHAHLFFSLYLLGPTDNADPPTSPQMRPFPLKREAENVHAINHVLLSQFFFFHRRALRFQPVTHKVHWTQWTVPKSMSSEAFWTPNTASSQLIELPKLGSGSKSSPN